MRQSDRNPAAESMIFALIEAGYKEEEVRSWMRNILRAEREGFSSRIVRRVMREARYYHAGNGADDLLSSTKFKQVIEDETNR